MCEASAYLLRDGKEELLLESVDIVEPQEERLFLQNIFGEQKLIEARIKRICLLEHKIILEKTPGQKTIPESS